MKEFTSINYLGPEANSWSELREQFRSEALEALRRREGYKIETKKKVLTVNSETREFECSIIKAPGKNREDKTWDKPEHQGKITHEMPSQEEIERLALGETHQFNFGMPEGHGAKLEKELTENAWRAMISTSVEFPEDAPNQPNHKPVEIKDLNDEEEIFRVMDSLIGE